MKVTPCGSERPKARAEDAKVREGCRHDDGSSCKCPCHASSGKMKHVRMCCSQCPSCKRRIARRSGLPHEAKVAG